MSGPASDLSQLQLEGLACLTLWSRVGLQGLFRLRERHAAYLIRGWEFVSFSTDVRSVTTAAPQELVVDTGSSTSYTLAFGIRAP